MNNTTNPNTMTDPDGELINAIEYHKHGKHWYPHSVFTEGGLYDFDWCAKVGTLAYHNSGSASTPYFSAYCGAPAIRARVWFREGITGTTSDLEKKELNTEDLAAMGIQVIKEPIRGNPFDDGYEASTD